MAATKDPGLARDGPETPIVLVLHHGAFESTLPDMADGAVVPMVLPGVRHSKRLQYPIDGDARLRRQQQVKVIGHQAIAVEAEGMALLGLGQRSRKVR